MVKVLHPILRLGVQITNDEKWERTVTIRLLVREFVISVQSLQFNIPSCNTTSELLDKICACSEFFLL